MIFWNLYYKNHKEHHTTSKPMAQVHEEVKIELEMKADIKKDLYENI